MGTLYNNLKKTDFLSVDITGKAINEEKLNKAISEWSVETKNILIRNVKDVAPNGKLSAITRADGTIEKKLSSSIGYHLNRNHGLIERVRFSFERHGVFLEKGVGKGTRHSKIWFNTSMDAQIEKLADIAAEHSVEINISKLTIAIK